MSLEQALQEIEGRGEGISLARLQGLSSLEREEFQRFAPVWERLPPSRRRQVLEALTELAEDNLEMDFTAVFRHALNDEDGEVRAAAIHGLWECEERTLIEPLVRLMRQDSSEAVRAAAAQALGRFALLGEVQKLRPADAKRVGDALLEAIDDDVESPEVRRRAIESVSAMSLPQVPDIIERAYEDEDTKTRSSALHAMGRTCDPRWLSTLRTELDSADAEMRFEAAGALGALGDESAVVDLIGHINDPDPDVQSAVVNALGAIGGPVARKALQRAAQNPDLRVAEMAEAALQQMDIGEDSLGRGQ